MQGYILTCSRLNTVNFLKPWILSNLNFCVRGTPSLDGRFTPVTGEQKQQQTNKQTKTGGRGKERFRPKAMHNFRRSTTVALYDVCRFFPCMRGFWGKVRRIIPRLRIFLPFFLFFSSLLRSAIAPVALFPSKDQTTVAKRAETTIYGRAFPGELRVSSFPCRVPTLCLDSIIKPTPTPLSQGCIRV